MVPPAAMTKETVQGKFYGHFQDEANALQQQIDRLSDTALVGGERVDATDHVLGGIARLSNEVQDATAYLPPYDQRSYSDAVKALSSRLETVRAAAAPRTKFAFKTRQKNNSAISLADAAQIAQERKLSVPSGYNHKSGTSSTAESSGVASPRDPELESELRDSFVLKGDDGPGRTMEDEQDDVLALRQAPIRKPSFSQANSVSISSLTASHIILPSSASHATSSGTLSKLRNCVIDMSVPTAEGRPFAGLTLRDIKKSLIICGHVGGPAHVTGLDGAIVVGAVRQFRMHESKNCDVYLQCASRPIIEGCEGIRFAPLPDCYKSESDKDMDDKWDQVDDFKWLKSEPSPNWSTLPQIGRIKEEVWTELVPGGPEHGLEEILKAVGIRRS